MRKVYFVRHAKPDFSVHDDLTRPLIEEAFEDCKKVTRFLSDKGITKVYSSPYKRAIDTVKHFAESINLEIEIIDDFRERKIDDVWIEDFNGFAKRQWEDFEYKLAEGECLSQVQKRNVKALMGILEDNPEGNLVVGSHGTALGTIVNYYNRQFDYSEFERIRHLMPFIVCFTFEGKDIVGIEEFTIG